MGLRCFAHLPILPSKLTGSFSHYPIHFTSFGKCSLGLAFQLFRFHKIGYILKELTQSLIECFTTCNIIVSRLRAEYDEPPSESFQLIAQYCLRPLSPL